MTKPRAKTAPGGFRARHVRRGLLAALAASALYVGCSSNPQPATPSSAKGEPQADVAPTMPNVSSTTPRTASEALAQLDAAEKQVDGLLGTDPKPTPLSTDGCETACKALGSMREATQHLCELSTDEPGRCDSAKARLERASSRVREVCPACASTAT